MGIVSYAQNFEDVILWRALQHVDRGFYIDIGAQHPVVDSVSKAFYDRGWRGVNVEPTKFYANLIRKERPDELLLEAVVADQRGTLTFYEIPDTGLSTASAEIAQRHVSRGFAVTEVAADSITLDDVFSRAKADPVHWLKIDVEGYEYQVLSGWRKATVMPWVIVVECTVPATPIPNFSKWEPLLLSRGYHFAHFDGLNRYYVAPGHDELVDALSVGPNVFDEFSLSGKGGHTFTHVLNLELAELSHEANLRQLQLDRMVRESAAASSVLERRIQDLRQRLEASEREVAGNAARERGLVADSDALRASLAETQAAAQGERQALQDQLTQTQERLAAADRDGQRWQAELGASLRLSESQLVQKDLLQQCAKQLESVVQRLDLQSAATHSVAQRSGERLAAVEDTVTALRQELLEFRSMAADQIHSVQHANAELLAVLRRPGWLRRLFSPTAAGGASAPPLSPSARPSISPHQPSPPSSIAATEQVMPASLSAPFAQSHGETDLTQLMATHGREFIVRAYQLVLGREPDQAGLEYYVNRLRSGRSKREIVAQIYLSQEVRIKGRINPVLTRLSAPYRWRRTPLLGLAVDAALFLLNWVDTGRKAQAAVSCVHLLGEEFNARFASLEQRLASIQSNARSPKEQPAMQAETTNVAAAHTLGATTQQHLEVQPATSSALRLEDLISIARHLKGKSGQA